jgi:hypothetical protein
VLHTGAPVDTPQTALILVFDRHGTPVVWHAFSPDLAAFDGGSPAQARAPPSFS